MSHEGADAAAGAGLADQPGRVGVDVVGHRHPPDQVLVADDVGRRQQVVERGQRPAGRGPGDLDFLGLGGIIQLDQEHEPVELRLGQRVGPFLLDRVLRGQDEERRLERGTTCRPR